MPVLTSSSTPARSAQWLADSLLHARLFDQLQLSPYLSEFRQASGPNDAPALAQFLVDAGILTTFQAERALAEEAGQLVLGPYTLVEPIGSGSMGTVYQAIGRSNRKRYAVKVLPLRSLWNVQQAKQQVQVFAQLPPHPAVVPFVDVDTSGGFHYMAWPYVMGQTLADVVRTRGPRPTDQAISIAAQIAEGLLLCHTHDVAHGLLKPSNLLMGTDRQARLLDLGIGAILSENIADSESMLDTISTANAAISMIDYAAPETLNSPQQRTPSGDIYSFGCTLYFLLTGGMPFPEGNAVDKILAHQLQKPRPIRDVNPTVPAWLELLTMAMMAKTAEERPPTADVLAALLSNDYRPVKPLAAGRSASPEVAEMPTEDHAFPPGATPWIKKLAPRALTFSDPDLSSSERTQASMASPDLDFPEPTDPLIGSSALLPQPVRVPLFGPAPSPVAMPSPTASHPAAIRFGAPSDSREASQSSTDSLMPPENPSSISGSPMPEDESETFELPRLPAFATSTLRRLVNLLTFWKPHADVVQLSIFGPLQISPGDNVSLQVFAHTPEGFDSVQTLSKVFHQNGELLATGFVQREVRHGQKLGLHLGVVNASVDRSEVEITWRGQPQPRKFDVYVPWESPAGPSPTVLSAGLDRVLAGRVAFTLHILPRKG
ncbi:hypothetical protein BH11PLA2_BH11PLA2_11170 [soil metagenome]